MKTKFNEKFDSRPNQTEDHGSNIQNYLESEISTLLTPAVFQMSQIEFSDLYISNPEYEKALEKYTRHTHTNNICFVEGLTGVGKTMLVRHVFDIHAKRGFIYNNNLVIPLSFDHALYGGVEAMFTNMVGKAYKRLEKHFEGLKHIDDDPTEFYDFIEKFREDLIPVSHKTPEEQLEELEKCKPLAHHACALKYYLNQDACTIDNVIIVVDDIEGIRPDNDDISVEERSSNYEDEQLCAELLPIKMTLELTECMQNTGKVKWSLNTIICCRHYVSRMIKTCPYSMDKPIPLIQSLQAYAPCTRLSIEKAPPLIDIIRKRYEALINSDAGSDEDKWEKALEIVIQILERVDNQMSDFILDLTLRNNREAMRWLKQVIYNKRWIQRDEADNNGAFEISDLRQYRVTQASIIRALGMNESTVYNSSSSIIPNLLFNGDSPYDEMDMFPLLTLKYFVNKEKTQRISWDKAYRISDFMDIVHKLFKAPKYDDFFRKSLNYLLSKRLLLRSYDQDQFDNRSLNNSDLTTIEYVYISRLASNLWQRLSKTSVFFEMFIDDIWIEHDIRNLNGRANRTAFRGFDSKNYEMCLRHLESMIYAEKSIYLQAVNAGVLAHNRSRERERFFGNQPVCSQLLAGLENSLRIYYRLDSRLSDAWELSYADENEKRVVSHWTDTILTLKNKCASIYSGD